VKSVEIKLPKPKGKARKLLTKKKDEVGARLLVSVVDASGNESTATKRIKISGKGK
jgi:hypothetical protein